MEFHHISVLLDESIRELNIKKDGIYLDGTAGGAGHSSEICKHLDGGMLIALDKDPDALKVASERLKQYPFAKVIESDFSEIRQVLDSLDIDKIDGILLDIGVSSHQLDIGERGFSYGKNAKLDMRMSQKGLSAEDVVNDYSVGELSKIFRDYGEENFAYPIAKKIVLMREEKRIETTFELVEIIKNTLPAAVRRKSKNPCKKVFQAIRIEVNNEFGNLRTAISDGFECLNKGGRMAIITFHSLEDRIVKQEFVKYTIGCTCPHDFPVCICGKLPKGKLIKKKPIIASEIELENNSRSKSAKLRVIEKT